MQNLEQKPRHSGTHQVSWHFTVILQEISGHPVSLFLQNFIEKPAAGEIWKRQWGPTKPQQLFTKCPIIVSTTTFFLGIDEFQLVSFNWICLKTDVLVDEASSGEKHDTCSNTPTFLSRLHCLTRGVHDDIGGHNDDVAMAPTTQSSTCRHLQLLGEFPSFRGFTGDH